MKSKSKSKLKKVLNQTRDVVDKGTATVENIRSIRKLAQKTFSVDPLDKAKIIADLIRWRLTWEERDLDYCPKNLPDKFVSAREAIEPVMNQNTVISSGFGVSGRCSIFFWAIRESFERTQHPKDLNWITVSAQGGRGQLPGTIEELGQPGLLASYICGHVETVKSLLKLADKGMLEIHTLPQGIMTFLIELQGEGKNTVESTTGVGTFLDPRCGPGSAVTPNAKDNYVVAKGDVLEYSLPKVEIAFLAASYADKEGNIYFQDAPTISENREVALAAHKNGGQVMVVVGDVIKKDKSKINIEAKYVDRVVVNPRHEQIGGVFQRNYWPMFTVDANAKVDDAMALVKFINTIMGVKRSKLDNILARIGCSIFTSETKPGALVNIGVGMPEEVSHLLVESGLYKDLTFTTEAGVCGGIPAPGIFFGAAINPESINSSAWMFHLYEKKLDITVLGFLQIDSEGNVNVSKRGPGMSDYIGPGGFCDIVNGAKSIIFVGSWMIKGKMSLKRGKLVIDKLGRPKFVDKVDQVTFNGQRALKEGKTIHYVTNVGVFKLTNRGLELIQVMPGVDIQKDIIDFCETKIILPKDGKVKKVKSKVVSGVVAQIL